MLTVRKNAIVIPLAAVQRGTQGTYVYTIKNGHANLQPVKVDMTQGNISLIASGVAEGDQVVVDGQDRLQSGATVEVQGTGGPGDRSNGAGPVPANASGSYGRPNRTGKAEADPGPGGVAAPQGLQRRQDAGKQN
jgi:multidrug efflux system membrane fusion protein